MREWINLYSVKDEKCKECGTIPSQVIGKPIKEIFGTTKEKRERKEKYGKIFMCSVCTQAVTDPPKGISPEKKVHRPRGWKFMKEFIDSEGRVFHKGIEQKDLNGTLDPTDLSALKKKRDKANGKEKKISKWKKQEKKQEIAHEIFKLKEEIKSLNGEPRTKTKIGNIRLQIKKLTQEMKKWN